MMFGLGFWELAILLAIIIIIFGAGRLPGLGRALGRSVSEFRKATQKQTASPNKTDQNTAEDPSSGSLLPELNDLQRIKNTTDKIRKFSRFVRRGPF